MIQNKAKEFYNAIYGKKYEKLVSCEICEECRKYCRINNFKQSHPVALNFVGDKFQENNHKILFIGLEAYYTDEYVDKCTIKENEKPDPDRYYFDDDDMKCLLLEENSNFWRWVRRISKAIIGKEGDSYNHIAWTNLHKCKVHESTLVESGYDPHYEVSRNCIQKCGWIYQEIKELNPKNIIIFGMGDEKMLPELFFQCNNFNFEKIENVAFIRRFDKEKNIRFISTYHPNYLDRLPKKVRERIFFEIVSSIDNNKIWNNVSEWQLP